jgi:hypothetical protein
MPCRCFTISFLWTPSGSRYNEVRSHWLADIELGRRKDSVLNPTQGLVAHCDPFTRKTQEAPPGGPHRQYRECWCDHDGTVKAYSPLHAFTE